MRQLELQQEEEERELLERGDANANPAAAAAAADSSKPSAPVRSQSGNDLAAFGAAPIAAATAAPAGGVIGAKSMPGSRRHSGEGPAEDGKEDAAGAAKAARGKDGQTHLNSFLFDDELDQDLQSELGGIEWAQLRRLRDEGMVADAVGGIGLGSADSAWGGKYLQMNNDDDKFPVLLRRDSFPNVLSAGSAASQIPAIAPRTFGPGSAAPGSRAPAPAAIGSPIGRPSSQLPTPRTGTQPGSGRASPLAGDKKLSNTDLPGLNSTGAGAFVDGLSEQFSNFNIDSKAFGAEGGFGSYGQDNGAFTYDSSAGQYGSMGANRFAGLRLEDLQGDMLPLCKDQFGCRYLQKKLEDGNPEHRDMIFNEIFPHFAELMTDPFANYLSQRLLEYSTDDQRDALIESIAGELVSISLNMHGTRAVQKMIDYLSTQRQVQSLILALNLNVVTLIKDLNGNHVSCRFT